MNEKQLAVDNIEKRIGDFLYLDGKRGCDRAEAVRCKLAWHCAPVLLGMKVANTLQIRKEEINELLVQMEGTGLSVIKLSQTEERFFLMVYREEELRKQLDRTEVQCFMCRFGYCREEKSQKFIYKLIRRFWEYQYQDGEFPHELGVFLGYPLEDLEGYLAHKGKNYRCAGYWKVYGDAQRAKRIFESYDAARETVLELIEYGMQLADIQKWSQIA